MKTSYRTTEAYLSGGICGKLWMPAAPAGFPFRKNLRGPFGLMGRSSGRESFEDTLTLCLSENGGDFQSASFTADTEVVIVRRRIDGPGKYTIHSRALVLADLFPDMVEPDVYTSDVCGHD